MIEKVVSDRLTPSSMNLFGLLSIGFIMGLTGAMAPGPLLTLVINESAKRGGIAGPMITLGHGVLEAALLFLIVLGLGNLLNNSTLLAAIALGGGIVLIYMGWATIKGLKNYNISVTGSATSGGLHPVVSGIIISISNPYWFIWWVTIGMGYVMFAKESGIPGIIAFFIGHISSDLVWYSFVSYSVHLGGRYLNQKVLKGVLFSCSLFMILFGFYFIVRSYTFFK
ncbi:MAG: lysine transporter LysE [Syntrophus sp. (in: bacteria)]|nr:lysine transporter LysE [Syntrophus sp. (in: bacteria)]